MPKRKLDVRNADTLDDSLVTLETEESDNSNSSSSFHTNSSSDVPSAADRGAFSHRKKRQKKSVQFQGVRVFYFPRKQGFTCVPSQGGSTLGMGESHMFTEDFTLKNYKKEQREVRKQILEERKQLGKLAHHKMNSKPQTALSDLIGDESGNSDSAESSESDLDGDDYLFLQPVSTRQRRLLLRSSGVKKIDTSEKEECRNIRLSREICGCDCRVFCDPETCACSQAGIKCQVDRLSFPCGCSKDGCGNVNGRIEFNPVRVRTHFIHTLMRVELDHKNEQHLSVRKLAAAQRSNVNQNNTDTIDLQQPLDNFTAIYHNSDINDNPEVDIDDSELDLSEYNSNEQGSCRDCQNTEIADALMQEAQLCNGTMGMNMCVPNSSLVSSYGHDELNSNHHIPDDSGKNGSLPHVMLFSDDTDYSSENTTVYTTFRQEESSYSESSECSSDLSDDVQNFRHFQELSSLSGSAVSNFADGILGSGSYDRSISSKGDFQPVTSNSGISGESQPEKKYIELSSSSYKLEPISEILNPIRYQEYQSHTVSSMSNGMWSSNAGHYSHTYPNTTGTHSDQCGTGNMYKCTSSNSQQSPDYSMFHTNGSVVPNDNVNSNGDQNKQLTNLDTVQSQAPDCMSRDGQYSSIITQSKESFPTVMSFSSLGKSSSESVYSGLSNHQNGSLSGEMTAYIPANVTAAAISNTFNRTANLCAQLASSGHEDVADNIVPGLSHSLECSSSGGQNFGEIIKESIVETVSA